MAADRTAAPDYREHTAPTGLLVRELLDGTNVTLRAWSTETAPGAIRCEVIAYGAGAGLPAEVEARRAWAERICASAHF